MIRAEHQSRAIAAALTFAFCAASTASGATEGMHTFAAAGRPFGVAVSADGATLFVSNTGSPAQQGGVRVFHRAGDQIVAGSFVPLDGNVYGIALAPDGATLFVANGTGLAALDARALARDAKPAIAYVRDGDVGAIEVMPSHDGTYAFISEESRGQVGVIRVEHAADGTTRLSVTGHVATGRAPVGMALSRDGSRLYVASEIAQRGGTLANDKDAQAVRDRCGENGARNGTLTVIDVPKAVHGDDAVVASFAAGCAPVRVALSPHDQIAWVTARGEDRLLAFDTAKMRDDPQHALVASQHVGRAPVGLAVVDGGNLVVVANSNRFSTASTSTIDAVDATKALAHEEAIVKSLPTGAFPRELAESPDGSTLYLTNFRSDSVQAIDEHALR